MAENDPETTTPPAPANPPAKVEFTPEQHEEINRIVAKHTAETERKAKAAEREQIETYLAAQKAEADRAEMEEIDRLKAERDEALTAAEQAKAKAKATEQNAAATTALLAAGVKTDNVTHAIRLLDLDAEDLDAEVTKLKETLPALFADADTTPPAPHLRPVGPAGPGAPKTPREAAMARRERRNPQPAA